MGRGDLQINGASPLSFACLILPGMRVEEKLTPEQRNESARKAIKARWSKPKIAEVKRPAADPSRSFSEPRCGG